MHWHPTHNNEDIRRTDSHLQDDGRLNISFTRIRQRDKPTSFDERDEDDGAFGRKVGRRKIRARKNDFVPAHVDDGVIPRMNVAILITGSRGDVQPFIALGQTLHKPPYCHRVRICTHPDFKDFVLENGLEFYNIGGDPNRLMAYMVKNPSVIPSFDSFMAGDIGSRKADLDEMLQGAWRACTSAGDGMSDIDLDHHTNDEDVLLSYPAPFVADAIIANPPTYAHIHIAEKLGIPCHIMFTMPWSPTRAFPHPLTNVDSSKIDNAGLANYMSYKRMELLTWEGLSDIVNHFREKTLGLDAVSPLWGHRLLPKLKVPFTYCWSQALIPKPADWGSHISIAGFFFLSLGSSYTPDPALKAFLDAGPPPVYIGFGSIVVSDPEGLTKLIYDAVKKAGVRALVSKGWGNFGGDNPPENVYLLGNVPHDWLFPRVSAVVHHGGAGTTAIGIALGKPTIIVPFFGDQSFWASMVYKAGAGPKPVPFRKLTSENLAENIKFALAPEVKEKAHELSEKIKGEEGPKTAAAAFHNTSQMQNIGCFLLRDRVAVWIVRRTNIQLSSLAAAMLVTTGKIQPWQLKLVRHKRWYVEEGSSDAMEGLVGAFTSTATGLVNDIGDFKKSISPKKTAAKENKKTVAAVAAPPASGQRKSSSSATSSSQSAADKGQQKEAERTARPPMKSSGNTFSSSYDENQRKKKGFVPAIGNLVESSATHVIKFPVTLMYNLANGFHNAPARLGDTTVRIRDPITGLGSGLKVGGKELGFGLYDAFTGVVTQPIIGYKQGKEQRGGPALGVAKGVGLGLFGLTSKIPAAIIGPFGYGGKGLEREISRWMAGTDHINGSEVNVIFKAKEEIRLAGMGTGDGRHAAQLMWDDAKGSGVGKRMVERRAWQGYREVKELRQMGEEGEKTEALCLERWEKLNVDMKMLAG